MKAKKKTLKEYHDNQRRMDEEALYNNPKEEVVNTPWLVLPHESSDMLRSVLREILQPIVRQEVSKIASEILREILMGVPVTGRPNTTTDNEDPLVKEIEEALAHMDYTRSLKWSRYDDTLLCFETVKGTRQGIDLQDIHTKYSEEQGYSVKAVKLRWTMLRRKVMHIIRPKMGRNI